jgi:hypothetical protein
VDGEELMETNNGRQVDRAADYRRVHDEIWQPDQSERDPGLDPGATLLVVLLLSFGLWWALWLALSGLASVLP